jgi:hypothetical protein
MLRKLFLFILTITFSHGSIQAQALSTKLKKGKVFIQNKAAFDYAFFKHKRDTYIYKKGSNEDVVIINLQGKKTIDDMDNYYFIYFDKIKKSLETREFATYPRQYIVNKLVEEGVLDEAGNFNPKDAEDFIKKYDERLHERRIAY